MAFINHRAREINFKIVYYGPGQGGKTTNLRILSERLPAERRGRLVTLATEGERTLFFDFMPVALGLVNGFTTRFHLYTTPGQVYYRLSRRAVLQGIDAMIFVADSHPAREDANRESLADLESHLEFMGLTVEQRRALPRVFQYNKRDLAAALPVERLRAALNPEGASEFEAVAREGRGVSECLRAACKAVLGRLSEPGTLAADAPRPVAPAGSRTVAPGMGAGAAGFPIPVGAAVGAAGRVAGDRPPSREAGVRSPVAAVATAPRAAPIGGRRAADGPGGPAASPTRPAAGRRTKRRR